MSDRETLAAELDELSADEVRALLRSVRRPPLQPVSPAQTDMDGLVALIAEWMADETSDDEALARELVAAAVHVR